MAQPIADLTVQLAGNRGTSRWAVAAFVLFASYFGPACGGPGGDRVSATLGASGGSLTLRSGAAIVVPAGALASDARITLATLPRATPPAGNSLVGIPISLTPKDVSFSVDAQVTIPLGGVLPPGTAVGDVIVLRGDLDKGAFVQLAGASPVGSAIQVLSPGLGDFLLVVPTGTDASVPRADASTGAAARLRFGSFLMTDYLGAGVTGVMVCARDPGGTFTLLSTDALQTGGVATTPTALTPGWLSGRIDVTASVASSLAGGTVEFYDSAVAGASVTTVAGVAIATCNPTAAPLTTIAIGGGAGQLPLAGGAVHTLLIAGVPAGEFPTACAGAPCPGPAVVALPDEVANTSTTTARIRTVLLDPRWAASPTLCHHLLLDLTSVPAPVVPSAVLSYLGGAYEDAVPLLPGFDIMTASEDPRMLILDPAGTVSNPCPSGTFDLGVSTLVGNLSQMNIIADMYDNNPGIAVARRAIAAGTVSTVFVHPAFLAYQDITSSLPCVAGTANCGSVGFCDPTQYAAAPTSCSYTTVAVALADE